MNRKVITYSSILLTWNSLTPYVFTFILKWRSLKSVTHAAMYKVTQQLYIHRQWPLFCLDDSPRLGWAALAPTSFNCRYIIVPHAYACIITATPGRSYALTTYGCRPDFFKDQRKVVQVWYAVDFFVDFVLLYVYAQNELWVRKIFNRGLSITCIFLWIHLHNYESQRQWVIVP